MYNMEIIKEEMKTLLDMNAWSNSDNAYYNFDITDKIYQLFIKFIIIVNYIMH
jgi:hypothetical protein